MWCVWHPYQPWQSFLLQILVGVCVTAVVDKYPQLFTHLELVSFCIENFVHITARSSYFKSALPYLDPRTPYAMSRYRSRYLIFPPIPSLRYPIKLCPSFALVLWPPKYPIEVHLSKRVWLQSSVGRTQCSPSSYKIHPDRPRRHGLSTAHSS